MGIAHNLDIRNEGSLPRLSRERIFDEGENILEQLKNQKIPSKYTSRFKKVSPALFSRIKKVGLKPRLSLRAKSFILAVGIFTLIIAISWLMV